MKDLRKIALGAALLCGLASFGFGSDGCATLEKQLEKLEKDYKNATDKAKKSQIDADMVKILEQIDKACK